MKSINEERRNVTPESWVSSWGFYEWMQNHLRSADKHCSPSRSTCLSRNSSPLLIFLLRPLKTNTAESRDQQARVKPPTSPGIALLSLADKFPTRHPQRPPPLTHSRRSASDGVLYLLRANVCRLNVSAEWTNCYLFFFFPKHGTE